MLQSGIYYNDWTLYAGRKYIYRESTTGAKQRRELTERGKINLDSIKKNTWVGELARYTAMWKVWQFETKEDER